MEIVMNKFAPIALLATVLTFAAVPAALHAADGTQAASTVTATVGKMIYGANGQRIAAVYRVTQSGAVQVILDGKLITVPASSLSEASGKVTTSLTKTELRRL
jgi:hypothetical protein